MIFQTPRLTARPLHEGDEVAFFELMSNPNVMDLVPQPVLNKVESAATLAELILLEKTSATKIWSLCEKSNNTMIGFCGLLKNNEGEDEIAYRLIERHWGKGYGTEIAVGLIDYCFNTMPAEIVTADVWIDNLRSIKIVEKFFTPGNEFFNTEDNCIDRRYYLKREDWHKKV